MDRYEDIYSNTPPAPPPKPGSHEVSRIGTPTTVNSPRPAPPLQDYHQHSDLPEAASLTAAQQAQISHPQAIPDPGEQWLPGFLEGKSKQDLAEILSTPTLLSGLVHAPSTAHASTQSSTEALSTSLAENVDLATHLLELESRLAHSRASAQALLLSAHALERQWRAKQGEMDHALGPFAPASLYQRLSGGLAEQEGVCVALEESFLEGEGEGGQATERETLEWVRRYRDARRGYYLRKERKERWDEGRVGGWR
ncbi:hypothetical protein M406DRAFT_292138 [Cryphonectria parasitica EP155]|uniref:VPS37 C-terminal domain-containing protein n=1 Tax=Cryphonectria parasitica (strain ATCC 38755 / EP155) TaxID=660469 RepID=A0A9P4Y0U2_CRYP1|nr:uncharacterized protein M406DRAFT_292138 [Cryphonectria parasitica EP155]KAF3764904.1 hypothetical protein M406DRAFT_292138 [Cryphonectria parasitica EP155]